MTSQRMLDLFAILDIIQQEEMSVETRESIIDKFENHYTVSAEEIAEARQNHQKLLEVEIITNKLIESGKSINGGWSREQLKLLGISWPPPIGWKESVISKSILKIDADKYISLKDKHIKKRNNY